MKDAGKLVQALIIIIIITIIIIIIIIIARPACVHFNHLVRLSVCLSVCPLAVHNAHNA